MLTPSPNPAFTLFARHSVTGSILDPLDYRQRAVTKPFQADPSTVDWRGRYTAPFTRVSRETAMTKAYNTFAARHRSAESAVGLTTSTGATDG
ncbi:MAG: hypothetical protein WBM50_03645 [Acidimicrobiales bacterium]